MIGRDIFRMAYQICPIILTGGVAQNIPGGMLPIISITQALSFVSGLLSGGSVGANDFFANFEPMPGGTLIAQKIGMYPFANQATAANAVIAEPLNISMKMFVPAAGRGGYAIKLATMMALQAAIKQHNALGGTYTIATPSFFYTNCVMLDLRDITSSGGSKQVQTTWQWDFIKPLLTLEEAGQVQNNLMSKITNGAAIDGEPAWSGLSPTVGQPPSGAAPSVVPASTGAAAPFTGPPAQ